MRKQVCTICGKKFESSIEGAQVCPECLAEIERNKKPVSLYEKKEAPKIYDFASIPGLKPASVFPNQLSYAVYLLVAAKGSDLHYKAGQVPYMRKNSIIYEMGLVAPSDEEIYNFVARQQAEAKPITDTEAVYDFSFEALGERFRCTAYHDMRGWGIALRLLQFVSDKFEVLGIPELLKDWVKSPNGLILVTGPTGSGKTTTLNCLINYMNETMRKHIITIEDPIEFVHENKNCLISQREIGKDTRSYESAILEALREDPDVIMVGEMRDRESIEAALRAAETGHVVLSTLHTKGAASTIGRILDSFPPEQIGRIRSSLSMNLIGTLSQRLIPNDDLSGFTLATEVMHANHGIKNSIREGREHQIHNAITMSINDGSYTFDKCYEKLYREGRISEQTYLDYQAETTD